MISTTMVFPWGLCLNVAYSRQDAFCLQIMSDLFNSLACLRLVSSPLLFLFLIIPVITELLPVNAPSDIIFRFLLWGGPVTWRWIAELMIGRERQMNQLTKFWEISNLHPLQLESLTYLSVYFHAPLGKRTLSENRSQVLKVQANHRDLQLEVQVAVIYTSLGSLGTTIKKARYRKSNFWNS